MAITPLPAAPETTDTPQQFNTKAFAWVQSLDTFVTEANAQATTVNADAELAEDWASKTDGEVDSTDYSSKAWAVGGTGVTDTASRGAAKEWATETSSTVDGTEYSAKEYAVGTQTRGTTGSAKDWATYTSGTVDGSDYSAKYHADEASTSASQAAASAAQSAASANVTQWSSGGTYAVGDNVFSPSDFQTYRNITGNNTATDPSSDATNWQRITGGAPGGSNTQIQYNNAGDFAGASGLVTDGSNLTLNAQGDVRFADSDSSNYVAFQAPATVASNVTWTLPDADGTTGQALVTNGTGTLSWATGGGGGSPGGSDTQVQFNDGGSFGGDAGLTYNKTTDVLTVTGGAVLQGLTAGRGAGAVANNTAFGTNALASNTTGVENVAIGGLVTGLQGPLQQNTIGEQNIAIGVSVLAQNTTGSRNTCIGRFGGYNVTTGSKNLVVYAADTGGGVSRLSAGTVGVVTIGTSDHEAFRFTTAGSTQLDGLNAGRGAGRIDTNVAFGLNALNVNTTGARNVAIGGTGSQGALGSNTIGDRNIAIGDAALSQCTSGNNNTVIGIFGAFNLTTGTKNIVVCGDVDVGNRLAAGTSGVVSIATPDAQRIRINTDGFLVPLVYDQTTGSAANVFVASDGKMSRSTSSQRYKKNIQDAVHGLDKVLQLRSVTFNHINPDEDGIVYGGLIAEEVHDLGLTEFVEYTWDGKPDSLRYGHMVSVLVKAVQELNARVVALETQGA